MKVIQKKGVRLEIDEECGAMYLYLADKGRPVAKVVPMTDDIMVDLDSQDNPVGVEILCTNAPCPNVVTSEEGTSYCRLAERTVSG